MAERKKRTPNKKKRFLYNALIVIFCGVFIFSAYKAITYFTVTRASKTDNDDLIDDVIVMGDGEEVVFELDENGNLVPVVKKTGGSGGKREIKIPESVDFEKLQAINPDVCGWIFSPNGIINYPILQKKEDNSYYLNHLYNNKKNVTGSLFLDGINDRNFTDVNTVIYGHNMDNGSMFASLVKYKKQSYYDSYPCLYLYTPAKKYRIDLFAGYVTKGSDPFYRTYFPKATFSGNVAEAKAKSKFKSNVEVNYGDKIVTMSTCAYDFKNARFVVIGKLVPLE